MKPGAIGFVRSAGSGTTGVACAAKGFGFIGIEREPHYLTIAQARINNACTAESPQVIRGGEPIPPPQPLKTQLSLFQ